MTRARWHVGGGDRCCQCCVRQCVWGVVVTPVSLIAGMDQPCLPVGTTEAGLWKRITRT